MPLTREQVEQAARGVPRRVAADPADGLGDQGQGPAAVRAGAPRARRSSGRRARCASTASRSWRFEPGPYPEVSVVLDCSSGTYVRALRRRPRGRARRAARTSPGSGALRVGSFGVDEAHPLEAIEADPAAYVRHAPRRDARPRDRRRARRRGTRGRARRDVREPRARSRRRGRGPVRGRRRRRAAARRLRTPGRGREAGRRAGHGARSEGLPRPRRRPRGRGGSRRHDRRVRRRAPRSPGGAATRP